jgi:hypothetical protein
MLMATYRDAIDAVRREKGFTPKTCWIGHVLAENRKTHRHAPNRLSKTTRKYPCPDHRRADIEAILRKLKMI